MNNYRKYGRMIADLDVDYQDFVSILEDDPFQMSKAEANRKAQKLESIMRYLNKRSVGYSWEERALLSLAGGKLIQYISWGVDPKFNGKSHNLKETRKSRLLAIVSQ